MKLINPNLRENSSSNLDLNGLGLLWLRRRQLLHSHSQDPILANSRNGFHISILRQHKLPHKLADPPLHPDILSPLLLLLPLPLAGDQKHIVVLHLDLDVSGLEAWHVNDEEIGVGILLDVRRRGGHGLGVADVRAGGGVERFVRLLVEVHDVLQCGEEWGIQTRDSHIHVSLSAGWNSRFEFVLA